MASFQLVDCTLLDVAGGTTLRSGVLGPEDAPALAQWLDQRQNPGLTWDEEGPWPLRDWAEAAIGKLVFFGRMEHLAGQLTQARQDERVMTWQERPYQNGSPTDDFAWYCPAYGVALGPTRLETMRRLVLHLAAQEPLILGPPEKGQSPHAPSA